MRGDVCLFPKFSIHIPPTHTYTNLFPSKCNWKLYTRRGCSFGLATCRTTRGVSPPYCPPCFLILHLDWVDIEVKGHPGNRYCVCDCEVAVHEVIMALVFSCVLLHFVAVFFLLCYLFYLRIYLSIYSCLGMQKMECVYVHIFEKVTMSLHPSSILP